MTTEESEIDASGYKGISGLARALWAADDSSEAAEAWQAARDGDGGER
jgi:hypothetical protein